MLSNKQTFFLVAGLVLIFLVLLSLYSESFWKPENDFHIHADLKVYLDGKEFDLNKPQFQEGGFKPSGKWIHLHDGEVLHMHKPGMTLSDFFDSIGMKFNGNCFVSINKEKYCNNGLTRLKMYVNGEERKELGSYVFRDLDKILVLGGEYTEKEIQELIKSVPGNACIESGKCPEKGLPSEQGGCSSRIGCSQ